MAETKHQVEGEEVEDEDEEMLDQLTEDDPVDRAMRVATASKLGLSDYSADEDEEDEEVVYAGNRSASLTPARSVRACFVGHSDDLASVLTRISSAPRSPLQPSMALPQPVQAAPSPRTAADLRQLLLSGGSAPPPLTGPIAHTPAPAPPPLTRTGSHPSSSSISNIWAPTSGTTTSTGSPLLLGGNIFAAPGSTAPHAKPVTPHSFEAIPNLTHGTRAAHAAGWLTNAAPAAASADVGAGAGSGLPPAVGLGAMYDGAFAPIAAAMAARSASTSATSPHAPGAAYPPPSFQQQPPPVVRPPLQAHASLPPPMSSTANNEVPRLSTAFAGLPQRNHSDLSPFAPTFGAGAGGYFAGVGAGANANANANAGWGTHLPPQPPPRSNGWG